MSGSLRERALRLLSRREHARAELARKLSAHAESAEELGRLMDDLSTRHLLSDERYVEMRINARVSRFGIARIAYEPRTQGVSEDLVTDALKKQCLEQQLMLVLVRHSFSKIHIKAISLNCFAMQLCLIS